MKVINVKLAERKENPHGVDVRMLYDYNHAQAVHIMLNPGESLKPHKTPVDVFFYILEGNPTIFIGDESYMGTCDDLIESPANVTHYLVNTTDKLARILVVKAPKPSSKTQIL